MSKKYYVVKEGTAAAVSFKEWKKFMQEVANNG